MSLDRQDVRAKLDPDIKAGLKIPCDVQGVTEAQFIEAALVPIIRQRIHEASLIAAQATLQGITGNCRERMGEAGNETALTS